MLFRTFITPSRFIYSPSFIIISSILDNEVEVFYRVLIIKKFELVKFKLFYYHIHVYAKFKFPS